MKAFQWAALIGCITLSQAVFAKVQYWQCTVHDSRQTTWTMEHRYRLPALNHALAACKKQSTEPTSCKNDSLGCELFINGQSTRPLWQCTSLDGRRGAFQGGGHRDKYEAAMAAKASCQRHSTIPASCYIHLITCRNLHATE